MPDISGVPPATGLEQQQAMVDPILKCINPTFKWPSITAPGLPNMLFALINVHFAGINLFLDLKPPTLDIFIKAFLEPIKIPTIPIPTYDLPTLTLGAEIGLPNVSFPLPIVGFPAFDISGEIKLMKLFILLPMVLFAAMIITLQPPTLSGIQYHLENIGLKVGIPKPTLDLFSGCVAKGIFNLLKSAIG